MSYCKNRDVQIDRLPVHRSEAINNRRLWSFKVRVLRESAAFEWAAAAMGKKRAWF